MKILLVTSEAVPFAKTGGLADVCGTLPIELSRLGHEVTLMMPAYRGVRAAGVPIEPTGISFDVAIGSKTVRGSFLKSHLPGSPVTVYFVEQDQYFDRAGLYQEDGQDYRDNCERFVFFSRAVLEAVRLLDLEIDVIHANDWQTGLVPAYLRIEYRGVPGYEQLATLFTIHNMAYQGVFWHWDMLLTGLDWKYFNWQQMEFFGNLNLLKTGLIFSDRINTVSARYAEEIQAAPLGCGLEGVLQHRRDVLSGIVNGVDYSQWDPEDRPPPGYELRRGHGGRRQSALQSRVATRAGAAGFAAHAAGRVHRSIDRPEGHRSDCAHGRDWLQSHDVQWVVLGTGDASYQEQLTTLARAPSTKVCRAARVLRCAGPSD